MLWSFRKHHTLKKGRGSLEDKRSLALRLENKWVTTPQEGEDPVQPSDTLGFGLYSKEIF